LAIWLKREVVKSNASVVFALLVLVFFIGEQVGIGGNMAFYDQIVPFMGLVVFTALPMLTRPRVAAIVFFLNSQSNTIVTARIIMRLFITGYPEFAQGKRIHLEECPSRWNPP
jgi:hypothetical protein